LGPLGEPPLPWGSLFAQIDFARHIFNQNLCGRRFFRQRGLEAEFQDDVFFKGALRLVEVDYLTFVH